MIFWGRDTARCGVRLCRVVGGYIRLSHPGGRSFGEWAILGEMCDRAIGRSGDREMGDRDLRTPNKETGFLPKSMGCNEEIPAVGNRVYTNDVRMVRGRRGYSEIENHRVKSSTREGGFCLCSRGFNRRGFWVSTAGGFVDGRSLTPTLRLFGQRAIGFFVDGRSNLKSSAVGNRVYTNDVRLRGLRNNTIFNPRRRVLFL